jgi:hypothetical protein
MYVQIILVTTIAYYKKRLRRTFLAPNTSTSLQTTLAADTHPAEGQFLHEEQTLNRNRNSETNNFQNGRAEFYNKVNMSKKESTEAMPPNT